MHAAGGKNAHHASASYILQNIITIITANRSLKDYIYFTGWIESRDQHAQEDKCRHYTLLSPLTEPRAPLNENIQATAPA